MVLQEENYRTVVFSNKEKAILIIWKWGESVDRGSLETGTTRSSQIGMIVLAAEQSSRLAVCDDDVGRILNSRVVACLVFCAMFV